MLAIQLKNYLSNVPDEANILIYTITENDERQLLMSDLDRNHDGNIVIDAEYKVKIKSTTIKEVEWKQIGKN